MMSESVMMGLAPHVGRNQAHQLVSVVANRARDEGQPFRNELLSDPTIRKHLSEEQIDNCLDPRSYLGTAEDMIDAVLSKVHATNNKVLDK